MADVAFSLDIVIQFSVLVQTVFYPISASHQNWYQYILTIQEIWEKDILLNIVFKKETTCKIAGLKFESLLFAKSFLFFFLFNKSSSILI